LTIEGEKIAEKKKARHDVEIARLTKEKAKLAEQVNKATSDHALEE
jgi:phenylpyruvate tautomerase PptA (4-oxalocrotonate tautomerase family)